MSGLYFIGEVVDVTGYLGGFNFQWTWASGFCAGQAVKRLRVVLSPTSPKHGEVWYPARHLASTQVPKLRGSDAALVEHKGVNFDLHRFSESLRINYSEADDIVSSSGITTHNANFKCEN